MSPALSLTGVTVHYPGAPTPAVIDATFELERGETIALLGPSGCGKSSLLRAIAGLEAYTGTILWEGRNMAGIPVHLRGFGLMFQDGQLFPHRTVGGNVAYGLQMAGMPRAQRAARVAELLELVGLGGYAGRRVATLSGGEQQRVALARALAPQPELLLLDEPLSALDRSLRETLADDLRDILRATATTALYVTHDQDEAFTVADRIALMRAGRIVQMGTPAEVWSAPVDAEAADFLGYRLVDGATLALGPRALHVLAHQASAAPARNSGLPEVSGTVHDLRVVRGEMIADVDIPDWGVHPAITEHPVRLGEQVSLRLQADQVVRFGKRTTPQDLPTATHT